MDNNAAPYWYGPTDISKVLYYMLICLMTVEYKIQEQGSMYVQTSQYGLDLYNKLELVFTVVTGSSSIHPT